MRSGFSMFDATRVPRVQFDRAHLRRADERLRRFDREQRRMARIDIGMLRDVRNRELRAVLLEEQLAADVLGRAHERHRAVLQMRQHPLGDRRVILDEIDLASGPSICRSRARDD